MYVSDATVCAMVDARDEAQALEIARGVFPDMVERFVEARDDMTLVGNAAGGRFEHPGETPASPAP